MHTVSLWSNNIEMSFYIKDGNGMYFNDNNISGIFLSKKQNNKFI